jgi:hypothetical protein
VLFCDGDETATSVSKKLPENAEMVVEKKKMTATESMSDSGYPMVAVSGNECGMDGGSWTVKDLLEERRVLVGDMQKGWTD